MSLPTDSYRLQVYGRDGVTLRDTLYAGGFSYTDEWRDFGSAQMTAKMLQAALQTDPFLLRRAHVKVGIPLEEDGGFVDVFAFLTSPGRGTIVGPAEDADKDWAPAGIGLLDYLNAWRVYPEAGLTQRGGETRILGWPAKFYPKTSWGAPVSLFTWQDATGSRAGYPGDWPDKLSEWIHLSGKKRQLFWTTFTFDDDTLVRVYVSADEAFRSWVDAVEIPELADQHDEIGYTAMSTYDVTLAAGEHTLAVDMTSHPTPDIGDGRDALLACVAVLDGKGAPVRIIRRSDATHWKAYGLTNLTDTPPGPTGAACMLQLNSEADDRGVQAAGWITPTFTDALASDGVTEWTDNQYLEVEVGTLGGDVLRGFMETVLHCDIDPGMAWSAATVEGTDRTADVFLIVGGADANVAAASWDGIPMQSTTLMGLTAEGWFESTLDGAEERVEGWLETGQSMSLAQGQQVSDATLPDLARERFTFTATVTARDGFVPYVDFFKGDLVTGINVDGSALTVRVTSISALPTSDDGVVQWGLELEEAP